MTAILLSTKPYCNNMGDYGTCARWSGEPTKEQAAEYGENEWSVGGTQDSPRYLPSSANRTSGLHISTGLFLFLVFIVFAVLVAVLAAMGMRLW